jgi:hypothetical protein
MRGPIISASLRQDQHRSRSGLVQNQNQGQCIMKERPVQKVEAGWSAASAALCRASLRYGGAEE